MQSVVRSPSRETGDLVIPTRLFNYWNVIKSCGSFTFLNANICFNDLRVLEEHA